MTEFSEAADNSSDFDGNNRGRTCAKLLVDFLFKRTFVVLGSLLRFAFG